MKKIALFDLDGSLADYELALKRDMLVLMSPEETQLYNPCHHNGPAYLVNRIRMIKNQPGWWLNLPRIESGFEVLKLARDIGYDVHVLTKGPTSHPAAWKEKLEWCQQQPELKSTPVHIVTDKSLVYGHFLYDDYPDYLSAWLLRQPNGVGIMPLTAYNQSYTHERVVHWSNDSEDKRQHIVNILQAVYDFDVNTPMNILNMHFSV